MKKILILLYMLVNCATSVAQFTQIQTNTSEILQNPVWLGNNLFIQNYTDLFLKSSDSFKTHTILTVPFNSNYINTIKETHGILYVLSTETGHTQIWNSRDTAISWQLIYDTIGYYADDMIMLDTTIGFMMAPNHTILKTQNGGISWSQLFNSSLANFFFLKYSDSVAIRVSSELVRYTTNQFDSTLNSYCSFLLNPMRGHFKSVDSIYFTSIAQGNYFVYTTDSAQSWHSVETSPFSGRGMYFFNGHEGYVVGRDYAAGQGAVYKTTDMGQTWIKYYTGIDCVLQDITFLNDSIALITGTNGVLLKWNKHSAPTGVEDVASRNDKAFKIYPNPAYKKDITIDSYTSKSEIVYVSIIDVQGNQVAKQQFNSCAQCINKFNMDIHSLSNGTYTMMILSEGKTSVQKIFIAK